MTSISTNPALADASLQSTLDAANRFRQDFESVRSQVARTIVGQRDIVEGVLTALFVGGHVLLEGVPGVGKTSLVRALSEALSLQFSRIQFTPDLMPADVSGTTVVVEAEGANGSRERRFVFQPGPIFGQIVLADEINRATPKTQSSLLEAMQERSVTIGTTTHKLPSPFMVLATQNPVEQEGTYPLPEAQLDRFLFKLITRTPSREEMMEILNRTTSSSMDKPSPVLDAARIGEHQALVRRVAIAAHVQDYAVRMVLATHPASTGQGISTPMVDKFVRLGASPRAAQTLVLAAKCAALLDGRAAASTKDIAAAALATLRHRLILNFEAHAEGVSADSIVQNLVDTLPIEMA
jgi:MoxR-like ATPase